MVDVRNGDESHGIEFLKKKHAKKNKHFVGT